MLRRDRAPSVLPFLDKAGLRLWLALLAAVTTPGTLKAQWRYSRVEEPRWLTLRVEEASTGVTAEGYEQTTTSGGVSSTERRYFLGPLFGAAVSGSVYHPNLFEYRVSTDGSWGRSEDEFSGTTKRSQTETRYLGSFTGTAKLLDNKPLHGNLYGNYTRTYQDYDFFNRIYLDRWRYGGGLHYTVGPWTFSGSGYQETQDSTGYGTPLKSDITSGSLDATHTRASGSSSISGTISSYTRNDFGFPSSGEDYTLGASDTEDFGSRKQYHSLVNLGLNHIENAPSQSLTPTTDLYNALASLRAEHTEQLLSQTTVNYSSSHYGSAESDNLNAEAYLQHKLYESLTSQLTVRGYRDSARNGPDRQDSWQFGGGPGVNYVKKLSASSTLTAYDSLSLLHTDVTTSGGLIPVIDEAHTAGEPGSPPGSFILRQPNVIDSTIIITDTSHQPPGGFRQNLDYTIIHNGQFTTIQKITGSVMPDSVLVSYNFTASPSGSYNTLNNSFGLRFDFFDHHLAIFTRVNVTRNYGSSDLVVQDLNDWVAGTEATWRFVRAGVEYEIYDSNLSPFDALRLFQHFTFHPEENSTLSLDFNQTFLTYKRANRDEQNYTGILRYNRALTSHLGLTLELGGSERVGAGVDQTLAVVRPQLQYVYGKFSAAVGYDFGYDEYLNAEKRERHMGFIRIRKEF